MIDRNSRFSDLRVAILLVSFGVSMLGCLGRSPDVEHYLLGTTEKPAPSNPGAPVDLAVLVGPARLPIYLERPQIAILKNGGEVELAEFSRWLGGFEVSFLRSLSLGLAHDLHSIQVVAHPSSAPFSLDYRVRLHIDDLVFVSDRKILRTRIRWALVRVGEDAPPGLFLMEASLPVEGDSIEAIVEAYEAAIAELSSRVAAEINRAEGSLETFSP
ncbi:MAG: membrane integrity-associated transporter subunit PqiC [bacterium]|nr:hypothetical protein [Deltaproteobacteria bacterium]MCP4906958.1 membrane integrity-associated transporter subunit PqiC [bacterium]